MTMLTREEAARAEAARLVAKGGLDRKKIVAKNEMLLKRLADWMDSDPDSAAEKIDQALRKEGLERSVARNLLAALR